MPPPATRTAVPTGPAAPVPAARSDARAGALDGRMDAGLRTELSQWMARLADGDREPLSAALARLLPELRRFTAHVLHGHADAEDAAQRAALSVFARAHEYEVGRDALAWALGI